MGLWGDRWLPLVREGPEHGSAREVKGLYMELSRSGSVDPERESFADSTPMSLWGGRWLPLVRGGPEHVSAREVKGLYMELPRSGSTDPRRG